MQKFNETLFLLSFWVLAQPLAFSGYDAHSQAITGQVAPAQASSAANRVGRAGTTQPPVELPLPGEAQLLASFSNAKLPETVGPALKLLLATNYEGCLAALEKVPPRSVRTEWTEGLRGVCYLLMGKEKDALEALLRAQKIRASNSDIAYLKALSMLALNMPPESFEAIREALWFKRLEVFPEAELFYLRAASLAKQGQISAATEALSSSITTSPAAKLGLIALSTLAIAKSDRINAIRYARQALDTDKENVAYRNQLVRALIQGADPLLDRGSIAEAEKLSASLINTVSQEDPLYRDTVLVRIQTLLATNKPEVAEGLIAPLLKKSPTDAELQRIAAQVKVEKRAFEAQEQRRLRAQEAASG